jgi:hypothetical protein
LSPIERGSGACMYPGFLEGGVTSSVGPRTVSRADASSRETEQASSNLLWQDNARILKVL